MAEQHGSATISAWMSDFVKLARSGEDFDISSGAEPGRRYAYLEFHRTRDEHSILLFRVEDGENGPEIHSYRFDGNAKDVREKVDALTHER